MNLCARQAYAGGSKQHLAWWQHHLLEKPTFHHQVPGHLAFCSTYSSKTTFSSPTAIGTRFQICWIPGPIHFCASKLHTLRSHLPLKRDLIRTSSKSLPPSLEAPGLFSPDLTPDRRIPEISILTSPQSRHLPLSPHSEAPPLRHHGATKAATRG